jgi:esterase/lipase superfamily enzyme
VSTRPNCSAIRWAVVLLALLLAGCQAPTLMPTPNLYAWGDSNPFASVPPALQTNYVDVFYITDRVPEASAPSGYGYKRSRSVGYGLSRVTFGTDVSWDELVKASRSAKRSINLDLAVGKTTELGRFPETPRIPTKADSTATAPEPTPATPESPDAQEIASEKAFHQELAKRVALSPVKDVYIFVHGYHNTFDDGVLTIAQLWHFFGREGVPVAYTWPAGSKGLLRGYEYDTASSEFTVHHLKQMLGAIARCPDVRKVHLICHSRGTDTTLNALRELHMVIKASGKDTRQELKLGSVVVAAPDIDVDIVIQKVATARLGLVPEQLTVYVSSGDKALGLSKWLFGGFLRFGEISGEIFTPAEREALRATKTLQLIDAQVSDTGSHGHDYFHSNPAVSSDLVLVMRYHLQPGPDTGRPLRITNDGFWSIDDQYPQPPKDKAPGELPK